jgi:hypothetical protein
MSRSTLEPVGGGAPVNSAITVEFYAWLCYTFHKETAVGRDPIVHPGIVTVFGDTGCPGVSVAAPLVLEG